MSEPQGRPNGDSNLRKQTSDHLGLIEAHKRLPRKPIKKPKPKPKPTPMYTEGMSEDEELEDKSTITRDELNAV